MSSAKPVRTGFAECLRFPTEGQSASGESGPKPRPTGVGDGQLVNIPVPRRTAMSDAGTLWQRPACDWSCRC